MRTVGIFLGLPFFWPFFTQIVFTSLRQALLKATNLKAGPYLNMPKAVN